MILLHDEELTIDAFRFDQFGDSSAEKKTFNKSSGNIVLPSFDKEVVEEDMEEVEPQESEKKISDEPDKSHLLLRELEKREAKLLEKEKKVLAEAQKKADEMIGQAQTDAEEIKKNAFDQASQEGYQEGYQKAYEENKAKMDEETAAFLIQVRDIIQAYEEEKKLLISQNIDELKELAISIAEKVIQISLKTSGEIIKKMIVTATSKMKYKEWAKIYISKSDSALIVESNADLIDAISHLSEHIKIIVMEDSAPGTCIIELPDQIIDASASTQIENIRAIMKSSGKLGGNDIV
ncbi:FliH/SctL family protein [Anaerotignum sp.]|uniref:FliH/SctL family protein n=1 Tax=Anaerotignum sp. TaxID=2039241 RepID=UPI002714C9AD|nr:FliH/SctL family protein [Anaerotignum sp.]